MKRLPRAPIPLYSTEEHRRRKFLQHYGDNAGRTILIVSDILKIPIAYVQSVYYSRSPDDRRAWAQMAAQAQCKSGATLAALVEAQKQGERVKAEAQFAAAVGFWQWACFGLAALLVATIRGMIHWNVLSWNFLTGKF